MRILREQKGDLYEELREEAVTTVEEEQRGERYIVGLGGRLNIRHLFQKEDQKVVVSAAGQVVLPFGVVCHHHCHHRCHHHHRCLQDRGSGARIGFQPTRGS
ncbi:hypothetical protein N9L68_08985 [bacterium]|nr:hypothetical protein [bacterium]